MRSYQFFPFLEKNGFKITVSPFLDSTYLEQLYSGKKINKTSVLKNYLRRFFSLFSIFKYDLIVIEKELFPYFPAIAEQILSFFKVKYMVDFDDALFHLYDQNPNKYIKFFLGSKIDSVMRNSTIVICGNSYLADRAEKAGAKRVEIIPTVIDLKRYKTKKNNLSENKKITIGWIGTPATLIFVKSIEVALFEVLNKYNVVFQFIGGVSGILENHPNIFYVKWTEKTEIKSISNLDIGIMPILDDKWAKGKCAYKLIQYMGCGLPVVGSFVGMNKEVIDENENGFLATTDQEWINALTKLIENEKLRTRFGIKGRGKVEKKYTLEVACNKLLSTINKII